MILQEKLRFLGDLRGELAGGREDDGGDVAADPRGIARQLLHDRHQEGQRLPCAGLCPGDDVLAGEHRPDGLCLDVRHQLVAEALGERSLRGRRDLERGELRRGQVRRRDRAGATRFLRRRRRCALVLAEGSDLQPAACLPLLANAGRIGGCFAAAAALAALALAAAGVATLAALALALLGVVPLAAAALPAAVTLALPLRGPAAGAVLVVPIPGAALALALAGGSLRPRVCPAVCPPCARWGDLRPGVCAPRGRRHDGALGATLAAVAGITIATVVAPASSGVALGALSAAGVVTAKSWGAAPPVIALVALSVTALAHAVAAVAVRGEAAATATAATPAATLAVVLPRRPPPRRCGV
mmetsp:Transcript_99374/g.286775  ORF Transcript_99374/g.286775 Transcript_99374/m.286775 type:complete len:358 (-) Transcript_99374:362-1435(-)